MTLKALYLVLMLNMVMIIGLVAYCLGDVPLADVGWIFKWFIAGVILSALGIMFVYTKGMTGLDEDPLADSATPGRERLMFGIFFSIVLSVLVFVRGVVLTVIFVTS